MKKKELIAKTIYEYKDSSFIIYNTSWEDLASFVKSDYLKLAEKILINLNLEKIE